MKPFALLVCLCLAPVVQAEISSNAPIRGILDNSFLVEEAYNQAPGMVQHIFTASHSVNRLSGPDDRATALAFTQEWPLFSQTHQISYTIPYNFVENGGRSSRGFGAALVNYRWQALFDEETLLALAPRFSLVLPTSEAEPGSDNLGYQANLPFSLALSDRWITHLNAGMTYLPSVGAPKQHDLTTCNLGASLIYAPANRFHLMLEWVGIWDESDSSTGIERNFVSVLSPGARYAVNFKNDAQFVVGLAAPIGLNRATADFSVFLYVSFEHSFLRNK